MAALLALFLMLTVNVVAPVADGGFPEGLPAEPEVAGHPGPWVYLTIDDGPSGYTEAFLATLAEAEVVATFFWIAGSDFESGAYDQLAGHLLQGGHQLGSHSTDHWVLTRLSEAEHRQQLARAKARLEGAAGVPVTLFRPPYGTYDRLTEGFAAELGQQLVLWTVDPRDWDLAQNPELIVARVMSQVQPGAIILIHERRQTLLVLPDLIAALRGAGYEFALLQPGPQVVVP